MDRESPCWVVAYNEMAAKTAAYILFDVYDSYCLWTLNRYMIAGGGGGGRHLDLRRVLGSEGNGMESRRRLDATESSRFRNL